MNNNAILSDNHTILSDNNTLLSDNKTLLLDNKTVLLDNHTMLSDIHRNVVAGQDGTDNRNQSVSATPYILFLQQQTLTVSQTQARSAVFKFTAPQSHIRIAFHWENYLHHPRGLVSDVTS